MKAGERSGPRTLLLEDSPDAPIHDVASLAAKYSLYGWRFVPLVTEELNLICGLEVLFMRPGRPGQFISAGDIDNRLKTLIDALRIPDANEEYSQFTPDPDEDPFFCLLEDDKLITRISVETDQLLDPAGAGADPDYVQLVITVRLRPYELHLGNMHFG